MSSRPKLRDCRECALQGEFTLTLTSEDPGAVLDGLAAVVPDTSFTAHLYREDKRWGVFIGITEHRDDERLAEPLAEIARRTHAWLQVTIEETQGDRVVFDHVYHPSGEMSEPIPG